MSFALLRRIANDGEDEAADIKSVKVDCAVTSTAALEASIKTIQAGKSITLALCAFGLPMLQY